MKTWKGFTPIVIGLSLLLPLSACIEKVRFGFRYDYPLVRSNPSSGLFAGHTPVVDGRADRSVDDAFKSNPIPTITDIVGREIQATLVFEGVSALPQSPAPPLGELKAMNLNVVVEPTLEQLKVGIASAAAAGRATDVLGALAAGASVGHPVDVEARATLSVRITDVASGKWVIRTYPGKAGHRTTVKDLDEGPTTELLATRALKQAMEQLRADLVRYVHEGRLPPTGSPT